MNINDGLVKGSLRVIGKLKSANIETDNIKISGDGVTIANGDKIIISDASNENKLEKSITIGTATNTYLRNDGSWATPSTTTYSVATTSANGLMSSADKSKLDGIASGATANVGTITGITMNGSSKGTSGVVNLGTVLTAHQDISTKENISNKVTSFSSTLSDTKYPSEKLVKNSLDNKVDKVSGKGLSTNDLTGTLKSNYDAAYTHSTSTHAPSNAQKNSDITKAEIEAKLTGTITTHGHNYSSTDTKNTAGSTDTNSKIFLIGATSQAANPQTYSHDTAYIGTDGCLYSNNIKVSVEGHTHSNYITADKYHTTGSWSGLTYTATANGSAGELKFTIPTGTTATTLAAGDHLHDGRYLLVGATANNAARLNNQEASYYLNINNIIDAGAVENKRLEFENENGVTVLVLGNNSGTGSNKVAFFNGKTEFSQEAIFTGDVKVSGQLTDNNGNTYVKASVSGTGLTLTF